MSKGKTSITIATCSDCSAQWTGVSANIDAVIHHLDTGHAVNSEPYPIG